MPDRCAPLLWLWILMLALLRIGAGGVIVPDTSSPPDTGVFSYHVHAAIEAWRSVEEGAEDAPPIVSLEITLDDEVTDGDLVRFKSISETVVIQGALGRLVQLQANLSAVEEFGTIDRVRSITFSEETILNEDLWR